MGSGYFNVKLPALKMSHYTEMKTKILPGYFFVQTSNIKACGVYSTGRRNWAQNARVKRACVSNTHASASLTRA